MYKKQAYTLLLVLGIVFNAAAQFNLMTPPKPPTLGEYRSQQRAEMARQDALARQQHAALSQSQQQQELEIIKADLREAENSQQPRIAYEFPIFQQPATQYFKQAFSEIEQMLAGKTDLSLKRAVFLSENVFLENTLSYEGFCGDIATNLDVLQAFLRKEGLNPNDATAKKYMLQKLFSDTLTMHDDKGNYQFTHYPFKYDFEDPFGKTDWRKMFVSKLLRDKKGQCHSMPLLYLIFAEELGIKAWLAFSPQHTYIKTQDNKGVWYNFETTNGHYSTDSWLLSSGYVKAEAMRNKIFMDTMSKKATVAACLVDLANGYIAKFGYDRFVLACAEKALQHNPKNIFALQLKSDYYTLLFQFVIKQLGYPPKDQLHRFPEADALLQKAYELYKVVDKLGYEEMPENTYQKWLQSFEKAKGQQPFKVIRP
jgi:hypothetical protein